MKKIGFMALGVMLLASPVFAGMGHNHPHEKIAMSDMVKPVAGGKMAIVHVKGLDCDFCARSLAKKLKAMPEVHDANVKLDKQRINIAFEKGKNIKDAMLEKTITDAGVNVVKINRK